METMIDSVKRTTVESRLHELALHWESLDKAVARGDDALVRKTVSELQRAMLLFERAKRRGSVPLAQVPKTGEGLQLLRAVKQDYEAIERGQGAYHLWMEKRNARKAACATLREKMQCTVDELLGLDFDPVNTEVVLVGRAPRELCDELVARGAKRIVIYCEESSFSSPVSGIAVARSPKDLWNAIVEPPSSPALQAIVHSMDGASHALEKVRALLADALSAAHNYKATVESRGVLWAKHTISNLPCIASSPSVDALSGLGEGLACVIVSPGPSLSRNIDTLVEHHRNAIVISSNRPFRLLDDRGICPDFVIAADPLDIADQLQSESLGEVFGLVLSTIVSPKLFALPVNRRYTFTSGLFDWLYALFGERGVLPSGGTVAITALQLAFVLGSDPIVFVGQDLAFEGEHYYAAGTSGGGIKVSLDPARGTFSGKPWVTDHQAATSAPIQEKLVSVPGWHGGTVTTSNELALFIRWLETVCERANGKVRIINATEGGARIQGMEHLPLMEVLDGIADSKSDVSSLLEKRARKHTFDAALRREILGERFSTVLGELLKLEEHVNGLLEHAETNTGDVDRLVLQICDLHDAFVKIPFALQVTPQFLEEQRHAAVDALTIPERQAALVAFGRALAKAIGTLKSPFEQTVPRLG